MRSKSKTIMDAKEIRKLILSDMELARATSAHYGIAQVLKELKARIRIVCGKEACKEDLYLTYAFGEINDLISDAERSFKACVNEINRRRAKEA